MMMPRSNSRSVGAQGKRLMGRRVRRRQEVRFGGCGRLGGKSGRGSMSQSLRLSQSLRG